MPKIIKKLAIFILFVALVVQITACKKKEQDSELSRPLETWSNTLISKVPNNAFAIAYWDTKKTAYEKYLASSWNTSNSKLFHESLATTSPFVKNFLGILKKSGYSLDEANWNGIFSENVLFAATEESENGNNLYFGLLVRSQDKRGLYKFIDALKQAVTEDGSLKIVPFQSKNPESFGIELSDTENKSASKTLYFSWKDDLVVIASSGKNLDAILNSTSSDLPAILRSDAYKKAVKGFPTSKNVFSMAYLDLSILKESILSPLSVMGVDAPGLPFSVLVMTASMDKELSYNIRLLSSEEQESIKFIASNVSQSSVEKALKATSASPLIMLSIDGVTAKNIIGNIAVINDSIKENIEKVFSDLKRLSIMGKIGMPLPDLMLVLESSSAEKESELLKRMISSMVSVSGSPSAWQRTASKRNPIDYINLPMKGLKIYISTIDNLTFIATSENIVKTAILAASEGSKDFTAQLSKNAKAVYAKDKSVANLYIDFAEVASLMERFGGMVGMYMPNEPKLKEIFEPKEVEKIRQFGMLVMSVSVDDDQSFRAKATYTKKK